MRPNDYLIVKKMLIKKFCHIYTTVLFIPHKFLNIHTFTSTVTTTYNNKLIYSKFKIHNFIENLI